MAEKIKVIDDILVKVEYAILTPLFIIMISLMVVQVVCRYFLHLPLDWSEEMVRYIFIVTTFLGGAVATKERENIEINFISPIIDKYNEQPAKKEAIIKVVNFIRDFITGAFMTIICYQTWYLVYDQYTYQMLSPAMQIPLYFVTGSMMVAMALIVVHSIFLMILNPNGLGITGYEEMEGDDI